MHDRITCAVITLSDKGAEGKREDISGIKLKELAEELLLAKVEFYEIIPDEKELLMQQLNRFCSKDRVDLVLTTGGTGVSPRDITPDATLEVIDKEIPGFGEVMRVESLKKTPNAILSRATAGVKNTTLIINLPGSPKAVKECFYAIYRAIPHAIEKIKGDRSDCAQG
jgi:molybdenum cofactor synthesis domain-containing protein